MDKVKWLKVIRASVWLALCGILPGQAAYAASEYQVKAALIYNLTRMLEWPNESIRLSNEQFSICFLGDEPFGDALNIIRDKKVQNRPIYLLKNIALGQASGCAMLFISGSEDKHLEDILKNLQGLPLLTLSDTPEFAKRGVMFNFVRDDKKVRMELNQTQLSAAGFGLNPALLKLVTIIKSAQ